jgi:hypothetical protein
VPEKLEIEANCQNASNVLAVIGLRATMGILRVKKEANSDVSDENPRWSYFDHKSL